MCIRDRLAAAGPLGREPQFTELWRQAADILSSYSDDKYISCLLYTSDAADERSSVDLGGRRIIKKKKTNRICRQSQDNTIKHIAHASLTQDGQYRERKIR